MTKLTFGTPEHRLGATAEHCEARPARIGGDKSGDACASGPMWSLRKMIHSTGLRATGSEMVASTCVASSARLLRRLPIALSTSATSASELSSVEARAQKRHSPRGERRAR